jgi:predicted AlkP superfamily phosphohydrolase/phosphomutase
MSPAGPVLAIAWDAADIAVVERLMEEGRLPTLSRLRGSGRFGRVHSESVYFMSAVWPTFYSGTPTGHHGWYYGKLWRPDRMRLEYGDDSWLDQRPFWEALPSDLRSVVFDVPYIARAPRSFNGVFVSGWQTHDQLGAFEYPSGAWRDLERRHGRPAMKAERFGRQTVGSLLQVRREALDGLAQTGSIAASLLASRMPDLFLLVLGGVHRATHYLWDPSQVDTHGLGRTARELLEGARDEVYEAADRTLGSILEAAPDNARVLVFALHGMARNGGWAERFEPIVSAIERDGGVPPARGLLYRVRRRLPWHLTRQVTRRIPFGVNRRLLPLWSTGKHPWAETRFFALPCDVNGFLRINLKGREAGGIVEPGPEYEALLDELETAFASFRTIETDEPVVAEVARTDAIKAARGPRRHLLPDLIVRWNPIDARTVSGVTSDRYGAVRWEPGTPHASGRSGNHRPDGWLVASGPGIENGPRLHCDALDLVPTLLRWLGQDQGDAPGRPVPELTRHPP